MPEKNSMDKPGSPAGLRLLTKKDVARLLACSIRMVEGLVASGTFTAVKIRGAVRFRKRIDRMDRMNRIRKRQLRKATFLLHPVNPIILSKRLFLSNGAGEPAFAKATAGSGNRSLVPDLGNPPSSVLISTGPRMGAAKFVTSAFPSPGALAWQDFRRRFPRPTPGDREQNSKVCSYCL